MSPLNRRTLLKGSAVAATTAAIAAHTPAAHATTNSPFQLGVASGDPAADGFVLWTRLALDPTAADGLGGMGNQKSTVRWEIATEPDFQHIVARGETHTGPQQGHSVHVEVTGLPADSWYYYRFHAHGATSHIGRTRTTPPAHTTGTARIAVASCAQWEHGWFTAYRDIAAQQPDLVVHLGDYLYEYGPLMYPVLSGRVRAMVGGETHTLADYRRRHALYRTDPDLQQAHAAAPWVTVFDDHEVDNDWAGDHHEMWGETPEFVARRGDAFQAYYENMPLRLSQKPHGAQMQLFRRITWGQLFTLHMLDTRQYRDVQVCGWVGPCDAVKDPHRTILGTQQENWLRRGYRDHPATWQVLGNQVMFAPYDQSGFPGLQTNNDSWDGYHAARQRVLADWRAANVENPVVLTGDYHQAFAFDIPDPQHPEVSAGVEVVTTSITSDGVGNSTTQHDDNNNDHLRFHQNQRGYALVDLNQNTLTVTYREVEKVNDPRSAVRTAAQLRVQAGAKEFTR